MTPVVRHDYRVGVPAGGWWAEVLNSDDQQFGGSGVSMNRRDHEAVTRRFALGVRTHSLSFGVANTTSRLAVEGAWSNEDEVFERVELSREPQQSPADVTMVVGPMPQHGHAQGPSVAQTQTRSPADVVGGPIPHRASAHAMSSETWSRSPADVTMVDEPFPTERRTRQCEDLVSSRSRSAADSPCSGRTRQGRSAVSSRHRRGRTRPTRNSTEDGMHDGERTAGPRPVMTKESQ